MTSFYARLPKLSFSDRRAQGVCARASSGHIWFLDPLCFSVYHGTLAHIRGWPRWETLAPTVRLLFLSICAGSRLALNTAMTLGYSVGEDVRSFTSLIPLNTAKDSQTKYLVWRYPCIASLSVQWGAVPDTLLDADGRSQDQSGVQWE